MRLSCLRPLLISVGYPPRELADGETPATNDLAIRRTLELVGWEMLAAASTARSHDPR
jgi:hypothetical protein